MSLMAFSDAHRVAPGGGARPPVATSPRLQRPLIFDREALRAFARSLRSPLIDTRYYLTSACPVSYLTTS